jgi:hypothetical protein
MIFDSQLRRDPGVACSRFVRQRNGSHFKLLPSLCKVPIRDTRAADGTHPPKTVHRPTRSLALISPRSLHLATHRPGAVCICLPCHLSHATTRTSCRTKKAELPPTHGVNRDSGTDRANGGWLRRLVRRRSHFVTLGNESNLAPQTRAWLRVT